MPALRHVVRYGRTLTVTEWTFSWWVAATFSDVKSSVRRAAASREDRPSTGTIREKEVPALSLLNV